MRTTVILLALSLAACGVADVGTSAATAAKLQAEQAKQVQDTAAQLTQKLDAANKAIEQRAAAADEKKE